MPSPAPSILMNTRIVYGVIVVGIIIAFWFVFVGFGGNEDIQIQPDTVAQKAAEETAKSESLFKTTSPLSGVEADPFEKTKKVLNPFEE